MSHPEAMIGFIAAPAPSDAAQDLFDDDIEHYGYVMNASRLWAYQPEVVNGLFDLMRQATSGRPFTMRERGILVAACASAYGDSYCSIAWGAKLSENSNPDLAAGVITGDDSALTDGESALAVWARLVARDPNNTRPDDVQALRDAGYGDADIFAMTVFIGLRLAFSTVNDALGARPDIEFLTTAPPSVLNAVTFGRAIDGP
jgi:uncharacterized protein YciW